MCNSRIKVMFSAMLLTVSSFTFAQVNTPEVSKNSLANESETPSAEFGSSTRSRLDAVIGTALSIRHASLSNVRLFSPNSAANISLNLANPSQLSWIPPSEDVSCQLQGSVSLNRVIPPQLQVALTHLACYDSSVESPLLFVPVSGRVGSEDGMDGLRFSDIALDPEAVPHESQPLQLLVNAVAVLDAIATP